MSRAPAQSPVLLRTAAVWGTTVLATRDLLSGQSLAFGDGEGVLLPKPDGTTLPDLPVRAVGGGWELDARGATGGVLHLRGREEDPVALGRSGAPIPIVAGDHGLLQYGTFGVFFQFAEPPPPIKAPRRIDWGLFLAFLFSLALIGGGLTMLALLTTPRALKKPIELISPEQLRADFMLEEVPEPPQSGDDKGKGIEDPGKKDKKDQGGGKKAKLREGALGRRGEADKTELTGDVGKNLGGMSEVLASDVGAEVQETLASIASVADALGGLGSDSVQLGKGPGLGLKGSGEGGGGDSDGVPFGAGTLQTGWGSGKGGGYDRGRGGPGGKGRGGHGRGGKGDGTGEGTGERQVAGAAKAKRGQGLSPEQIRRIVMSRYGAFRACYESAAARNPKLQGGVTVAFTVTPAGSVSGARVSNSSLSSPRVEGCILRQFRRLRFPAADKPTGAAFPFLFKPSQR